MNRRNRTIIALFIGILLSGIALYSVFRWSGWDELQAALSDIEPQFILLASVVFIISMFTRAACWHTLLERSVSYGRVVAVLNEGYLLNNVLPWRLGEIGKAVIMGSQEGMSILRALSTIFVERSYDLFIALALLIGLLPLAAGIDTGVTSFLMIGGFLVLILVFLWIAVKRPAWIDSVLGRLPGGMSRWGPYWERFREGLSALENTRSFLISFGWLALSWFLAGWVYWLALRAVTPEPELSWAFFMLPVTLLGSAIPSVPGYIGVFEAAGVLALTVFGVSGGEALAATLLLHGMIYVMTTVFGAIALSTEGQTLTGIYRDIQQWMANPSNRHLE